MNPLRRLLQRLRGVEHDELRSRQRSGADAQDVRRGVFGRLNNVLRRRRESVAAREGGPPRFAYSYRVFWISAARAWSPPKRRAIAAALERTLSAPDFAPTVTEPRFAVAGLDRVHSGASLLALRDVLEGLGEDEDVST
jgi:hypothetical protein